MVAASSVHSETQQHPVLRAWTCRAGSQEMGRGLEPRGRGAAMVPSTSTLVVIRANNHLDKEWPLIALE